MPSPIITVEQMRAWEEASWHAGRDQQQVIRTVGRVVAECASTLTNADDAIVILAGKGNNGADARAAASNFIARKVQVMEITDPEDSLPNVRAALNTRPRLIIDGLFGIGLNRSLSKEWIELINVINAAHLPVLSIDVPSGLNGATGQPEGAAIEAAITLTLGAIKQGLLLETASPFIGRLELASDIGLIPCPIAAETAELLWSTENDFHEIQNQRRPAHSHKGMFGHLAILAGALGYHGAAVLAARGAQGAHPGLITVITHADTYIPVASQLQSVMVHPFPSQPNPADFCTALVAGPGLAAPSADKFRLTFQNEWRALDKPMIVDASALNWLETGAIHSNEPRVLTPHPGEAARLLGISTGAVQSDRAHALRQISEKFNGCWVILKGRQTLIGRNLGPIYVNSSGNPFLAQGGSGDVLAGFLGGLLAQPHLQKDIGLTVRFAVWAHGAAADRLSARKVTWTIEELAAEITVGNPIR